MYDTFEIGKFGKAHINGRPYAFTTFGTIKSIEEGMITFIDNLDKIYEVAEKDFKFSPVIQGEGNHKEIIKCNECGLVQWGLVVHSVPFWTYLHTCDCGNLILESEWETVEIEVK